ncbi:MAG: hypothetical protein JKX70_03310 [Phycisphaerales bacterium]|nr:hypothetical protein [Phycisphaerales bacterium]
MKFAAGLIVFVAGTALVQAQECAPSQGTKLTSASAMPDDHFGASVAGDNDILVIGVPDDDEHGETAGAVYVYRLIDQEWVQEAKLESEDISEGDLFGNWVSIDENLIVIGAPGDDDNGNNSGSAYIFKFVGGQWVQETKLNPSDAGSTDFFGGAVSISGSSVVIGATRNDELGTNAGSAYVFSFDGGQWNEQAKLLASDGEAFDAFGVSLCISGDTVIIGAPEDDDSGNSSGSAYIFTRTDSRWTQQAKLIADDGGASDFFAISVGISGNNAVIGSYWDDDAMSNAGAAYIFAFDGKQWTQQTKLFASDASLGAQFGFSVSIQGNTVMVGANKEDSSVIESGSAYLFEFDGSQWSDGVRVLAEDGIEADRFGGDVAVWDGFAMSSAVGHDSAAADGGAVYIFDLVCSCPADFTGDGNLNFFDVAAFLSAFAAQDPIADLNDDGSFNFFDVSAFLTAFAAGCP